MGVRFIPDARKRRLPVRKRSVRALDEEHPGAIGVVLADFGELVSMLAHSSIVLGSPPAPIPMSPRCVSIMTTLVDWLTMGWPCLPLASPGLVK